MSNIDWGFFSGVHHFYSPIPSLKHIKDYEHIGEKNTGGSLWLMKKQANSK